MLNHKFEGMSATLEKYIDNILRGDTDYLTERKKCEIRRNTLMQILLETGMSQEQAQQIVMEFDDELYDLEIAQTAAISKTFSNLLDTLQIYLKANMTDDAYQQLLLIMENFKKLFPGFFC